MTDQNTKIWVLPPCADNCQICGAKHEPELPHNAQSLYYQVTFNMAHGRAPTWIDAMEHCAPELRDQWRAALIDMGVDVDGGAVNPTDAEVSHG